MSNPLTVHILESKIWTPDGLQGMLVVLFEAAGLDGEIKVRLIQVEKGTPNRQGIENISIRGPVHNQVAVELTAQPGENNTGRKLWVFAPECMTKQQLDQKLRAGLAKLCEEPSQSARTPEEVERELNWCRKRLEEATKAADKLRRQHKQQEEVVEGLEAQMRSLRQKLAEEQATLNEIGQALAVPAVEEDELDARVQALHQELQELQAAKKRQEALESFASLMQESGLTLEDLANYFDNVKK